MDSCRQFKVSKSGETQIPNDIMIRRRKMTMTTVAI